MVSPPLDRLGVELRALETMRVAHETLGVGDEDVAFMAGIVERALTAIRDELVDHDRSLRNAHDAIGP